MKKGLKTVIILLCAVFALIAAFIIRDALLPKYESSGGKIIVNGSEYNFDDRFSLDGHGAVIGMLERSGEKVCRADDGGYFLYVRSKPFTLPYNPLVREDAVEAYFSGVSRLVLVLSWSSDERAVSEDKQVINDFMQAILSEEGHVRIEADDVRYSVGAASDAFPTVGMSFEVIVREGKYYAETEPLHEEGSDYVYSMFAPLGESASAWLESCMKD